MATQAGQTCIRCGQSYAPAQMEMTEDGPRCFRCSQAAAIAQHHANSAEQLESHNRTVTVMSGFQFWHLEFRCTHCSEKLAGAPGPFSVSLPPATIACQKCGRAFTPTFWHRARWMSSLILKVAFLVVVGVRHGALRDALPNGAAAIAGDLLLSFGIALGVAIVLAIPAALVTGSKPPA
jgi:hypothetical protein